MMEVGIQRTDSNRLQQNGPRVSFNRDVHVKRIAKRPNETNNYPIKTKLLQPPETSHLRRELPKDLTDENILKEAALVLAQAERVKCKTDIDTDKIKTNQKNHNVTIPNKFNSLPTRKKAKSSKPVSRSVSDVSSKKSKKPSIFNIFSRKSDTSLNHIEEDIRFKESGGRRLIRSKSNIEDSATNKLLRKRYINENDDILTPLKAPQLSPIIENSIKEDYFEKNFEKSNPCTPEFIANKSGIFKNNNKESSLTLQKSLDKNNIQKSNFRAKDSITKPAIINPIRSPGDMHSSQLPQEKLPLTKGRTVDGMVKRLSLERFSPPPLISTPAFSYTRPNEPIIYAQLAPELEERNMTSSPINLAPMHGRSMTRDAMSPPREYRNYHSSSLSPNRIEIQVDSSHGKKSEVYLNGYNRVRNSASPQVKVSEWRQLTPKNFSDDDEGLGYESKKYFDDEIHYNGYKYDRPASVEPPIVPVIRSSSPIDLTNRRGIADGMDSRRKEQYFHESFNEFNNLSNRREALESKFKSRKFGHLDTMESKYDQNHHEREKKLDFRNEHVQQNQNFLPEQFTIEEYNINEHNSLEKFPKLEQRESAEKFHRMNDTDVVKKYSPERSHLDMVAPKKSSKYTHTKYFNDGSGGVKEIYQKETKYDNKGKPHTTESRRLERLDSPQRKKDPLLDPAERYLLDCGEPKSIDSQFSDMYRSSPENMKRTEVTKITNEEPLWQNSLRREKRQQRSFDKGDSGIENDFRKESFNGDLRTKWRRRTTYDDISACESFLRKERRHTDETYSKKKKYDIVFRERSIDDGSHFDPRLDKYPKETTLQRHRNLNERYPSPGRNESGTLKREKKIGGFEKMKKLFSSKKKENKEFSDNNKSKPDRYMVKEDEMRSRYEEHRPEIKDHKIADIAMRRRLSTPRASPLLKRIPSDKSSAKPLTLKNETESKGGWFRSLERKNKKKSNLTPTTSFRTTTDDDFSTLPSKKKLNKKAPPPPPPPPTNPVSVGSKTLRFFGDTDLDSNPPTISKNSTTPRHRPALSTTLNRNQKYSQSAYDLDRISKPSSKKNRSTSLQNLEDDGIDTVDVTRQTHYRRHHSRNRNLNNISESGSETEERKPERINAPKIPPREPILKSRNQKHELHSSYKRNYERDSKTPNRESDDFSHQTIGKPPPGPPKPARSVERNRQSSSYSRERERVHDSSGTEGDSSLHSQRSVVYLHATTIGDIPQPAAGSSILSASSRRRNTSRDELKKAEKPMTRTVSRSVSMLAPWTPKKMSDGYEINYSQDNQQKFKSMPRKHTLNNSSSSRTRKSETKTNRYGSSKEDLSSKSGISSRPSYDRRSTESRKSNLSRRKMK